MEPSLAAANGKIFERIADRFWNKSRPILFSTRRRCVFPENSMDDWSSVKLCDVAKLLLGMVLFFSPWAFGLSIGAQWQTASTVGIVIAVLSIAALAAFAIWEEWLNLIAGLTLIVSPWLLGFQNSDAMTIDVTIGALVAALAAFEVWALYERPAQAVQTVRSRP
jgi:hypothetical protein